MYEERAAIDEVKGLVVQGNEAMNTKMAEMGNRLDGLEARVSATETKANRPAGGFSPRGVDTAAAEAERKAVGTFVRTGDDTELKAMAVNSDPDGGFTVVPQMAQAIRTKIREVSPVANLARRIIIEGSDSYAEPFDTDDMAAQWVGETASRPAQATPKLGLLNIPLHEIFTSQPVTQKLLDTSPYDIGGWLEARIANKFARTEGAAFVSGNGVEKPRGFLALDVATDADSTRAAETLQYIPSGASGAFAGTSPADVLVDLVHSLRAPYRANAAFLMNSLTAGKVRKLKDSDGRFLWADSLTVGTPASLLGHPVYLDETMPDIAANSLSIAFGDFAQGYTIVEQPGIKMLRDPFSAKPNVIFYAYRRVGGDVADADAIKLMKFAES